MSSVSQCHHVSGLYVFMNMALFNPVFTFSPLSIIQYFYYRLNMSGAEYSGWLCPLCLAVCSGLWQREFSKESTDHRTFLGKKYTKVMMMHRAGKKKNTFWCAALLPANKCSEKQFECWNGLNICKVQSASLLFITVYLLIYLPRFSYFMYRLKTTRWNAFLLRLQLKML